MPHLVLSGEPALDRLASGIEIGVVRWGRAVIKTAGWWLRNDGRALLVEGVVVELGKPLHPVALVAPHHGGTIVRLWPIVTVERTRAVQRWLAILTASLRRSGAGALLDTNLPKELWSDLPGLDARE